MFYDRQAAGKKLAMALKSYYQDKQAIILAIPRGGVLVAKEVAKILRLPLDLIIVRKLPMPDEPEAGIGAISETGEIVWQPQAKLYAADVVEEILTEQQQEVEKRVQLLRKGRSLPDLKKKTVILIDDGLAMGSTMAAAIRTVYKKGAKKVIVAVPVAGEETVEKIKKLVDELVCLLMLEPFYAVAQAYENWYDVSDQEVIKVLKEESGTQAKNWSAEVTNHSFALDLEEGVFTWDDPQKIACSLKKSAEVSQRRKGTPFQSAMSMLNFYINRAGKNLPSQQKKVLEQAKVELRKLFHK